MLANESFFYQYDNPISVCYDLLQTFSQYTYQYRELHNVKKHLIQRYFHELYHQ